MARGRREHTREQGVCKYPFDEPEQEWTCPGCSRTPPRPRGHEDHTDILGECRSADTSYRMRGATAKRGNQHPREGRVRASSSSVADLPGSELNPGTRRETGDPELPPETDPRPAQAGRIQKLLERMWDDYPNAGARPMAEETPLTGGSSGSGEVPRPAPAVGPDGAPTPRAVRGPDLQPRQVQPRLLDRAVGDVHEDWTSLDVNRSMRMLRTGSEAQIRRELRKLHLRWWHECRWNEFSEQQASPRKC